MLVLSRKADQQILIGKDVSIAVLEISGNRVRIGIAAPASQQILRGELAAERQLVTVRRAASRAK